MSRVVLDSAACERLLAAGGQLELKNGKGEVVARFKRVGIPPAPRRGYVIEGDWPTDEEIDRRLPEGPWVSAAEVEARLRKLREEHG